MTMLFGGKKNKGGAYAPDMTGRNLAVLGHSLFLVQKTLLLFS
jgi:hypothetical protein